MVLEGLVVPSPEEASSGPVLGLVEDPSSFLLGHDSVEDAADAEDAADVAASEADADVDYEVVGSDSVEVQALV